MSGSRDTPFVRSLREWWLVNGDRLAVAAVLLAVVFAGSLWLTLSEVLRIGEGSYIPTLLGSGVLSGLATIITVTLSINQLILSRIFGAPNDLNDRLDATLDFRRDAAAVLDVTTVSNDPGTFLVEISEAVRDRASALEVEVAEVGDPSDGAVRSYAEELQTYAEQFGDADDENTTMDVLSRTLSSEYAEQMTATRHLREEFGDDLSAEAEAALDDLYDLLRAVAITRQFLKTMALQQDLALLSKRLIYSGLLALAAAVVTVLLYTSQPSVAVPATLLPWVVSAAFVVVFAPMAILVAHIFRVATVTRYTVSVGPFVPPEEQTDIGRF